MEKEQGKEEEGEIDGGEHKKVKTLIITVVPHKTGKNAKSS